MEAESRHRCLLYQGPPANQLPALAAVIRQKLSENYRCLYLNSPPMISGIRAVLSDLGVGVVDELIKTNLVLTSESTLTPDGNFDIDLMLHKLEDALDRALNDGYKGLWASGDMSWEFGGKENLAKLLEYEWRLEELLNRREALCGICQYHHDTLPSESMRHGLLTHRTLFVNETLSCMNTDYIQSRALAAQKAANPELDSIVARICEMRKPD